MVGDSLGYRDHAEVACGVLGYGGCGVVGVVSDESLYTKEDLSAAYREGWKRRDSTIALIQPTTARDQFYGERERKKATVRPTRYHASLFTTWLKSRDK